VWRVNPPEGSIQSLRTGEWDQVRQVDFLLFNFPDVILPNPLHIKTRSGESWWKGSIEIEGNGWTLELQTHQKAQQAKQRLDTEGGHELTHLGRIKERTEGALQETNPEDLTLMLQTFFSFARGSWVSPLLPVGVGPKDEIVWREWSAPHVAPGRGGLTWLDPHEPEALTEVGEGIFRRWGDEVWRRTFRRAVALYLDSNRSSGSTPVFLETRILLALDALQVLVQHQDDPAAELGPLNMFDQALRLRLEKSRIPVAVPELLPSLKRLARNVALNDGPSVLSRLRGQILNPHADEESDERHDNILEAWQLSAWYLELLLLRQVGFSGRYASRLKLPRWVGDVEAVPWGA
jgi:hypothetical protein